MRRWRTTIAALTVATGLGAALVAPSTLAQAHGPQGEGPQAMGPGMGYGMGRGMMMGPGMGYGRGPGMTISPGMGYGGGPGMMMGPRMGYGWGPGMMMGPGMGYGWGPGMMQPPAMDLSVDDVKRMLQYRLAWWRNPNLKLGKVEAKDDDTIVAEIVTKDGSLVRRYAIDRHTGWIQPTG